MVVVMVDGPERRVPLLCLDLDSTVRKGKTELGRFVHGPTDVEVFPEAVEMMRRWKAAGGRIIGVSNQGGIALGIVSMAQTAAAMKETYRQAERLFDKIAWCSHHPDASDPEMARCWCRKPSPGLIVEAAVDLARAHPGEIYPPYMGLMVGDRPEDQECARLAGLDFQWAHEWRAQAPVPGQDRREASMTTPYGDLPIEVRRANWGWFGEPWWSSVCYDEDGKLIEEMRKPFPVGECCLYCGEEFDEAAGDSGTATVAVTMHEGRPVGSIAHVHKECQFRQVAGGLAHHEGRCHCHGGEGNGTPGMTLRQEAVEVWRRHHEGTLYIARGAKGTSEEHEHD